jgi:hypothetical protein
VQAYSLTHDQFFGYESQFDYVASVPSKILVASISSLNDHPLLAGGLIILGKLFIRVG